MGRRSDLVESLGRVPLFAACSKSDLKILSRHMVEVEVPAGAKVVGEGDVADAFYVVIEGEAGVAAATGKRARVVATLGPGSWFGELAILDASTRNASVTAKTPMVLGVLGARVFRAVLRDVPALTEKLLAGMARRLREADRILSDVGSPSAASSKASSRKRKPSKPAAKRAAGAGAATRRSAAARAPRPRQQTRTARSGGSRAR